MAAIECLWRGDFADEDVEALHAEGFGHPPRNHPWLTRLQRHSLGWVCATTRPGKHDPRHGAPPSGRAVGPGAAPRPPVLIGFVNVAWDGDEHAFVLDTVVARAYRGNGVGRQLLAVAATGARTAGCAWLHVDFEDHLSDFYLTSGGFRPTSAGLIAL